MANEDQLATRVAVLDMQPIDPPIGGGRIRLLGLYHGLGAGLQTHYVGSFDWPGEAPRSLQLTAGLLETDVPLSARHFEEDRKWRELAGGTNVIDTAFPILGRLSTEYVDVARQAARQADVVVMSHPWSYPLVCETLDRERQLLVYDAQNAESLLRWELLGDAPFNREIAKSVVAAEKTLVRAADLIVACSESDARFFVDVCGAHRTAVYVAPNGVFVERITPPDAAARAAARRALDVAGMVALFIGSNYAPNVEAARFIAEELCDRFPDVTFAICGGVGTAAEVSQLRRANLFVSGTISEEEKLHWLQSSDVAVNPMFTGSGTNVKMFDFMAAGLPVVATSAGARGITEESKAGIVVAPGPDFPDRLAELILAPSRLKAMGRANRIWAQNEFAWERISPALGARFSQALAEKRSPRAASAPVGHSPSRQRDGSAAPPPRLDGPLAIFSTWGVRCGIAEYTAYLARALRKHGVPLAILGNREGQMRIEDTGSHMAVDTADVARVWSWDTIEWKHSQIDLGAVERTLRQNGSRALSIQYHPSFYNGEMLGELVVVARAMGLPVTVTLHNSNLVPRAVINSLVAAGCGIVVHKRAEAEKLRREYPGAVHHLLMGVAPASGEAVLSARDEGGPTIATFGFLRSHKGLLELLQSLALLKGVFPSIRLVAKCATYPAEDSHIYHEKIGKFIAESALGGQVELDTRFCPLQETISALARADVIVLPYAPSDEGASGSLATVLSAGRPVIVARSPIFEDVEDYAYVAESNHPEVLAAAIATVLSNPDLASDLGRWAKAALERSAWPRVSLDFLNLAAAPVCGEHEGIVPRNEVLHEQ